MPFELRCDSSPVVVQGKVYVGGGSANKESDECIVMEYDIRSETWATLTPYRAKDFVITAINNQLVLVGGYKDGHPIKMLGVWRADRKEWTYPYPDMHTARSNCSAASYTPWLIVGGGLGESDHDLDSVEVLNTDTKQWYAAAPMPIPTYQMKTAVVGDVYYAMGGFNKMGSADKVYSVSIQALKRHINSKPFNKREHEVQIWKEIPGLQLIRSAPCSFRGSLLAVGGADKDHKNVTAIHLYQPATGDWVKVGDLPTSNCYCACTMITDREMLVAGGWEGALNKNTKRINIALLN